MIKITLLLIHFNSILIWNVKVEFYDINISILKYQRFKKA